MSCLIQRLQGGTPEIFPISIRDTNQLRADGAREIGRFTRDRSIANLGDDDVFVGAALKPDGSPFYLCIVGPSLEVGQTEEWKGAFYAPFGVGEVVGSVNGDPNIKLARLSVKAQLLVQSEPRVSAEWVVIGSQETRPNKAALISNVTISIAGPHAPEDIRRCIALHAPQRALGEPRAIVAMQCGVAVAALIEAIC
jgi:hypothetical protein